MRLLTDVTTGKLPVADNDRSSDVYPMTIGYQAAVDVTADSFACLNCRCYDRSEGFFSLMLRVRASSRMIVEIELGYTTVVY